jgi:hypothetical protein
MVYLDCPCGVVFGHICLFTPYARTSPVLSQIRRAACIPDGSLYFRAHGIWIPSSASRSSYILVTWYIGLDFLFNFIEKLKYVRIKHKELTKP